MPFTMKNQCCYPKNYWVLLLFVSFLIAVFRSSGGCCSCLFDFMPVAMIAMKVCVFLVLCYVQYCSYFHSCRSL